MFLCTWWGRRGTHRGRAPREQRQMAETSKGTPRTDQGTVTTPRSEGQSGAPLLRFLHAEGAVLTPQPLSCQSENSKPPAQGQAGARSCTPTSRSLLLRPPRTFSSSCTPFLTSLSQCLLSPQPTQALPVSGSCSDFRDCLLYTSDAADEVY